MKNLVIGDKVKNKITGKIGEVIGEASYKLRGSKLFILYETDGKEAWDETTIFELSE